MQKTQNLRNILTEITQRNNLEPKMLEQKVFDLWRKYLGAPFGTKTTPISLSDGVLKIYTEYPPYRTELLFHKPQIIADLNAELERPILTDLRIELRQVHAATSQDTDPKQSRPDREPPKSSSKRSSTDVVHRTTPEELEQIEQTLTSVTDARLKKSLRQLFITQNENKS